MPQAVPTIQIPELPWVSDAGCAACGALLEDFQPSRSVEELRVLLVSASKGSGVSVTETPDELFARLRRAEFARVHRGCGSVCSCGRYVPTASESSGILVPKRSLRCDCDEPIRRPPVLPFRPLLPRIASPQWCGRGLICLRTACPCPGAPA